MSFCSSLSSTSKTEVFDRARRLGPVLLPLVIIGGGAFDNGGYDATTWGWLTLVPLVGLGAALLTNRARRPGGLGLAFLGLLAAFTTWTFASVAWSDDVAQSVLEGERLLVFLATAAAFIVLERGQVRALLGGVLAAITAVCAWALYLRAFGGSGSYDVASVSADATHRLAAPIGYSNGLGLFAAIGILLGLGLALRLRRPLAAVPVLVLGPTLYFTYSRGAWLALGAGALAAVALAPPRVPRPVLLVIATAVVALLAIALVRVGGPAGAYHEFSHTAPTVKANKNRRLFSLSGSSRAQYWHVAWKDAEAHPWVGSGAGSFQRRWLRFRLAALPVLDAHSLFLETLAEVGLIGLVLLAGLLGLPLLAAFRARGDPLAAPALAGYVAYLVHAAQDWDWELPAVTLAGLACAVALLLLAERRPAAALMTQRVRASALAAAVLIAVVSLGAFAGNEALAAATNAVDGDHPAKAERSARLARRLVPWSPVPWRLHGEAVLSTGDVKAARRDFRRALAKDSADWESWADLALVTEGAARRAALVHAQRLNPLSQGG
jgi:hypothetical protein